MIIKVLGKRVKYTFRSKKEAVNAVKRAAIINGAQIKNAA
jgi:hypothetical protein